MSEFNRITRIASRAARRAGVSASVYANHKSFDVMAEKCGGVIWIKNSTRDAFMRPALVARNIRREMREAFG